MSDRREHEPGIRDTGKLWGSLALAALVWAGTGCDSQPATTAPEPAATQETPADTRAAPAADAGVSLRAEAEQIFATRCQTCHGPEGAGDGPGAAALTPKPRNFQDQAFQEAVSDEHIANIIQFGGAAVGKSPTMPGNPDLTGRPELVKELVAVVRQLGRG